ncbi:Asp23/Gls24 family envelope stress response protein [Streptomyces tropicalis]|uniref:Asp23/Gls24 family envelope stress response protein n=1 Tax=Streptomyces tropicalis TaxID=3034234 RepID=A0ABT6A3L3_9ACTN|nr:Asp23/Gls24 family envelope stress response protein [Streptomyces tropicalis]MDF3299236.1 Asp23/Gls24 family envelope stress response protein [Streptomyces tropicalis]
MTTRTHPPGPPPPHDPDDERLPCGRMLSRVWADWEDGATDAHTADCPHCREAVADLDRLETTVRALRDDTAGYDAAPLTRRVMDVVRMELRPGRPLPLGDHDEDLWVMEAAAARTLRAAAERVPGVRAGSCRFAPGPAGGARGPVAVRIEVHAPLSTPDLHVLAGEVRRRVLGAADRLLGLDVTDVDIRITDLVEEPDGAPDGRTEGGPR